MRELRLSRSASQVHADSDIKTVVMALVDAFRGLEKKVNGPKLPADDGPVGAAEGVTPLKPRSLEKSLPPTTPSTLSVSEDKALPSEPKSMPAAAETEEDIEGEPLESDDEKKMTDAMELSMQGPSSSLVPNIPDKCNSSTHRKEWMLLSRRTEMCASEFPEMAKIWSGSKSVR